MEIVYLKDGNERQRAAWKEITSHKIMEILRSYDPILVGTIPIGIDIPGSDLDIICNVLDHKEFRDYATYHFGNYSDFGIFDIFGVKAERTAISENDPADRYLNVNMKTGDCSQSQSNHYRIPDTDTDANTDCDCPYRDIITIVRFTAGGFPVEIYAQATPTIMQNAYRHMLIEYLILEKKGPAFRKEIIRLKEGGLKTEPAFAKLLHIPGDPYLGLLEWGEKNLVI